MFDPSEPQEQTFTTWRNPLDRDVNLDLYVGSHIVNGKTNHSPFHRYVVPAGATKQIPREFDDAIAKLHEHGMVVSGKAPFMQRVGVETELHPALAVDAPAPAEPAEDKPDVGAKRAAIARKAETAPASK